MLGLGPVGPLGAQRLSGASQNPRGSSPSSERANQSDAGLQAFTRSLAELYSLVSNSAISSSKNDTQKQAQVLLSFINTHQGKIIKCAEDNKDLEMVLSCDKKVENVIRCLQEIYNDD